MEFGLCKHQSTHVLPSPTIAHFFRAYSWPLYSLKLCSSHSLCWTLGLDQSFPDLLSANQ